MVKTQTTHEVERYAAPSIKEHALVMKRHILDGSFGNTNENIIDGSDEGL